MRSSGLSEECKSHLGKSRKALTKQARGPPASAFNYHMLRTNHWSTFLAHWHLTSQQLQSIPPIEFHLCSCLKKSNEIGWKFVKSKQTLSSFWVIIIASTLWSTSDLNIMFHTQTDFQICLWVIFFFGSACLSWLRVQAFFHKTVRVCHVYCNFKIGFTCRITVIFGTLKDESLLINILASNICFSYRNMFQNGVDALLKIVDAFLTKAQNFI